MTWWLEIHPCLEREDFVSNSPRDSHTPVRSPDAEDAMTEAEKAAFYNGYILACCNLVHLHHEESLASDVLGEAGISEADVQKMDLCEYDAEALKKIREARSTDPLA